MRRSITRTVISSNRTAHSGAELNIPTWIAEGWLIYKGKQFGTHWDSSLFSMAHLWIKEKSEKTLLPFLRRSFQLFWKRARHRK